MDEEILIKTHLVYEGRIVNLQLREVQLPDGRYTKREIIKHSGAAGVVPLDNEGNVYLVKQLRFAAGIHTLEIPAGLLDGDESPSTCAIRELQEEVNFRPGTLESLGGFYVAPGYTTEYIHLFIAYDLIPSELAGDTDEQIEIVKLPFDEAIALIDSGDIVDSKTIIALLKTRMRFQ